jgi:hypothetical protein
MRPRERNLMNLNTTRYRSEESKETSASDYKFVTTDTTPATTITTIVNTY